MIYYYFNYLSLLKKQGVSERSLVERANLSRGCVRSVARGEEASSLRSLDRVAKALSCSVMVLVCSEDGLAEYSIVAVSMKIQRDGLDSWKIHLMNFVDEFRRTLDPKLILLGPVYGLDPRINALIASSVQYLCSEAGVPAPAWAEKNYYLPQPWFLSEMQSLKASALLESPLPFRRNNIFTHINFLERA